VNGHRTETVAAFALALVIAFVGSAAAGPKKALGDYSKVCQDEHLKCLNDCQTSYPDDKDALTCMGVCDDWLDDACDKVFPKALVRNPATTRPPAGGVLEPAAKPGLPFRPKAAPRGGVGGAIGPAR
jgi:hypothetical protein